ncbi:TetR/AcrR family transcriptional regulator [Teredinibacter waterburyi]|jgi:Transcriptional regulator|uniref:TetR/AcrR family transcriptional regulator n=1 Tax=Teredinibacter waterburyi TaxID=1500538 RepID=UPI00165F8520|nr:TetR/AcrR family transcriptional regulator [Teredinibacter waterburyi]
MSPPRDPEVTRRHIIEISAQEMLEQGFKAASLSTILEKAEVSKGALYHHFASKKELGYAVFEEIFAPAFFERWGAPLVSENPVDALKDWLRQLSKVMTTAELEAGCPTSKIAMEMGREDDGFRDKAMQLFSDLGKRMEKAFVSASAKGYLRPEVKPGPVAIMIVATMQGLMMQGKVVGDIKSFRLGVGCLIDFVESLQPK